MSSWESLYMLPFAKEEASLMVNEQGTDLWIEQNVIKRHFIVFCRTMDFPRFLGSAGYELLSWSVPVVKSDIARVLSEAMCNYT